MRVRGLEAGRKGLTLSGQIRSYAGGMPDGAVPDVRAPSAAYATPRAAMAAILQDYMGLPDAGERGWLTFAANQAEEPVIQYAEPCVNLALTPMDLPTLLRDEGEDGIARDVRAARAGVHGAAEGTLWEIDDPTPDKIARIVDVAFSSGHDLGPGYQLLAHLEPGEIMQAGPLDRSVTSLSGAGWGLVLASCAAIVLVAALIGPWVLDLSGHTAWRKSLPAFAILLAIPGLFAGILVYLGGRRMLARAGIATHDPPDEEASE